MTQPPKLSHRSHNHQIIVTQPQPPWPNHPNPNPKPIIASSPIAKKKKCLENGPNKKRLWSRQRGEKRGSWAKGRSRGKGEGARQREGYAKGSEGSAWTWNWWLHQPWLCERERVRLGGRVVSLCVCFCVRKRDNESNHISGCKNV